MTKRHFEPALKTAGLRKIRFHDLRHTYASIQIDLDQNIKYIQSQLGHSSSKTTLDTYGHLMKNINQDTAKKLGDPIFCEEDEEALKNSGSKTVAEK